MALSHPPGRNAGLLPAYGGAQPGVDLRPGAGLAQSTAMGPATHPRRAARFRRRLADDRRDAVESGSSGVCDALVHREPLDAESIFQQLGRRAPDRSAARAAAPCDRTRHRRLGTARDRRRAPRTAVSGRVGRRRSSRICLRELRRAVSFTGLRTHRLERLGAFPGFSNPRGRLRGSRGRLRARHEVHGLLMVGANRPLAARCRGLAWHPCAV